jgi:uncharacterized RmlC-like cupin family protein
MASSAWTATTGVRVIKAGSLDANTAQTPGMDRRAAVTLGLGATQLWAGTVNIHAGAKTGAHHHGSVESVIYVLTGRARMRWGSSLEFAAEAEPGDFIFVPPYVPHQEINALDDAPLRCVIVRSQPATPGDAVIHNLPELAPVEESEILWVDGAHPAGHVYRVASSLLSAAGGGGADPGHADHEGHAHSH